MTRILSGLLAAALLVAGCGSSEDHAEGPDDVAARVRVVSQTMSGVPRLPAATPLPTARAVGSYAARLGPLGPRVRAAARALKPGSGEALYAQVVYVGCHPAPSASVTATRNGDTVVLTSDFTEAPQTECYAPVVSVALAVVPH